VDVGAFLANFFCHNALRTFQNLKLFLGKRYVFRVPQSVQIVRYVLVLGEDNCQEGVTCFWICLLQAWEGTFDALKFYCLPRMIR
jgi:hypothetical protein